MGGLLDCGGSSSLEGRIRLRKLIRDVQSTKYLEINALGNINVVDSSIELKNTSWQLVCMQRF